ncbi:MAG: excinuclease ABC subunit UvrC [Anaerolineales bacterium]|uniref:UvrABC system protein C n=1 Tax=Candidatus Desulfolinea nitratireducens TaxID=2841698 RepID=A0A8J6NP38_9CHLR|nr:excinuclease ABC subunit UvrC [Candidatus Desulfolinea nitratireducens]MBL6959919.1 excinuclease ABC subunit UvrC [Anaerolineales bacterium]
MQLSEQLQGTLATIPTKPGCYLMKNAEGKIIYVGKAVNLRNRVRSYFHASAGHDRKTRRLVQEIADVEWIVVGSELEALILEMNLIKRHRPHFNVRLKDDKRYPYIKVHWGENFPKVTVTRQMRKDDGSRYYGPYTSVWAVHQTLDLLRRIFPYLTCDREITGLDKRACLYLDIKLCTAPCIGAVNQSEYRQMIADLGDFLNGRTGPIVKRLQAEMAKASEDLRFEKAAALRDQLNAIEKVVEKQKVITKKQIDSDVIAMARTDGDACVQIFFIRSGKMVGREYFMLEGTEDSKDSDVVAQFVKQFYTDAANVPAEVLLPKEIEEAQIIKQWLNTKRGGRKVEMRVPRRGQSRQLVQMATENAAETLKSLRAQWQADTHKQEQSLAELQEAFQLKTPPNRIECYDISNTQGVATVGSMVVFTQGVPDKKLYRRFNIRSVTGPDDFASMEEALTRRFKRWQSAQEMAAQPKSKKEASFSFLPDLLIVDGGKGQLSRAVQVLEGFGLGEKIPVVGLAKREEEIFFPYQSEGILLPRHSQGLYLIQRIRDEAHRFAITAHRKQRNKIGMASVLDIIPGIGPARRKSLLQHFGSLDKIRAASMDELAAVSGITVALAETIKANLE